MLATLAQTLSHWGWPQYVAAAFLLVKVIPTVRKIVVGYDKNEQQKLENDLAAVIVWSVILSTGGFFS